MSDLVPSGWKVKSVAEVANNFDGQRVALKSTDRANRQGGYRYYGASNIIDYVDDYIFDGDYILLGEDGENVLSRNLPLAFIVTGKFWVNNHAHVLQPKENIDLGYLCEVLEAFDYKNIASGSAQPKITQGALNKIRLLFPPLPEQQKIAAILTSVDDVIEKTQAQIDKLKDLKTGMMQELLTNGIGTLSGSHSKPHTEFKDSPVGRIPKSWELVKLSDLLTKIDSGWSPSCIETPPSTGEWGVLKVSAVTRGKFLDIQSKTLPPDLQPREHLRVRCGDILLTRANGVAELVGKCVMVKKEPKSKLMMSDKILRLNPNERAYSHFLLHAFNSQQMRKQIELSWGGSSGQKNISQDGIKSYYLALPSYDEQKAIGDSISHIDSLLAAKEQKLAKVQDSKKALMQDLLTGKVRVAVPSRPNDHETKSSNLSTIEG